MRFREWLSAHNYAVYVNPRGFQFEDELGNRRYVQLFKNKVTRHVDDDDIREWIKNNIHDAIFSEEARSDFRLLAR